MQHPIAESDQNDLQVQLDEFTKTVHKFQQRLTHLNEDLVVQSNQIHTVTQIGRVIISTLDHRNVLQRLMKELIPLLGVDRGSFWLVNEEMGTVEFQFSLNYNGEEDVIHHVIREFPADTFKIGGQTLVGQVSAHKQPLIENRPTANPNYFKPVENLSHYPVTKIITVPILQEGAVVAIVQFLNPRDGRSFDERDQNLLMAVAPWVAVALKNAGLYSEAVRQRTKLEKVAQIGRKLISTLDYREVLRQLMQELISILQVSRGSFWLVRYESNLVDFQFSLNHHGLEDEISDVLRQVPPENFRIGGHTLVGQVAATGQPLIENHPDNNPHHYKGIDRGAMYHTRRILSMPLTRHKKVIAVIQLLDPLDGRDFTQEDQEMLAAVMPWVALAIENAWMYGQALDAAQTAHARRMKAELKAKEVELDAATADMARLLAHHLKNRLGGARMDLYQLRQEGVFESSQKRLMNEIDAEIKRSMELAVALFKPYQTEGRELVSLADLVDEVLGHIDIPPLISVQNHLPPDLPFVEVEPENMKNHIVELFSNGFRAVQEHLVDGSISEGQLLIRLGEITSHEMVIEFANNGPLIPADLWHTIFEKFVSTNRYKNTHNYGLGLWGARIFVRRLGGDLFVKASDDGETVFAMRLPSAPLAADASALNLST